MPSPETAVIVSPPAHPSVRRHLWAGFAQPDVWLKLPASAFGQEVYMYYLDHRTAAPLREQGGGRTRPVQMQILASSSAGWTTARTFPGSSPASCCSSEVVDELGEYGEKAVDDLSWDLGGREDGVAAAQVGEQDLEVPGVEPNVGLGG